MTSFNYLKQNECGTKDFPVIYNFASPESQNYNISVHWHKEWEIIRIIKGSFSLQVDTKEYTLNEGDFALICSSALHTATPDNCVYECLILDIHTLSRTNETIRKHLRPLYNMEILPFTIYTEEKNKKLCDIVTNLFDAAKKYNPKASDHTELELLAWICNFFAVILENKYYIVNPDKNIKNSPKIGQIKLAIEYIENNYQEAISLNDLSRIAGMSSKYFCKIFKDVTHRTPMDYVILYRIEQACVLLSTTNIPIIDIAFECGFNDCSYFIRTFKKIKNKTPSQYRNE